MSPRGFLIAGIAFIVLVGVGVTTLFIVNRSPQVQNTVLRLANKNVNAEPLNVNLPVAVNANTNTVAAANEASIKYVSRNFSEIFGSGSNQNDFANLKNAERWTTKSFTAAIERLITEQRKTNKLTPYHGFVTRAIVIKLTTLPVAPVKVSVMTQRTETIDKGESVYYQELLLTVVKEGKDWKVDAATWQPRVK